MQTKRMKIHLETDVVSRLLLGMVDKELTNVIVDPKKVSKEDTAVYIDIPIPLETVNLSPTQISKTIADFCDLRSIAMSQDDKEFLAWSLRDEGEIL